MISVISQLLIHIPFSYLSYNKRYIDFLMITKGSMDGSPAHALQETGVHLSVRIHSSISMNIFKLYLSVLKPMNISASSMNI
jgi:hypothetical protein